MSRRIALVVNPTSGRGLGARVAPRVRARLESAGLTVDEYATTCAEDVGRISAEVVASGADGVALVGGDGTVHLGAQVLAKSGMPFGVIPAGTGNDFARGIGVPLKDPLAAADLIVKGDTRAVDLAMANDRYITTVVAGGFDSLVNKRANEMNWPKGNSRYTVATLAELRTFNPLSYVVTVDGKVIETDAMLVAVGTGPTYGGGLQICAGAEIDDGLLDITIIKPVSRLTLLQLFPKLSKGTHVGHPAVHALRGSAVRLESAGVTAYADGEILGPLPVDIGISPGALTVFA
ncbi:diacylglycerol/lipid kinase family protein [Kribbella qitaiheensis]|uniref:diacylglycerol/lipid kinase family protein n=1 Tax=Kribbella qitaiheensis TaxID=1544730 RepID=UPI00361FA5E0